MNDPHSWWFLIGWHGDEAVYKLANVLVIAAPGPKEYCVSDKCLCPSRVAL